MALMVLEEQHSGKHKNMGLLYITSNADQATTFHQAGANSDGSLSEDFLDLAVRKRMSIWLRNLLENQRSEFESIARNIKIGHISWTVLAEQISELCHSLDKSDLGQETIWRLFKGFQTAIEDHSGT